MLKTQKRTRLPALLPILGLTLAACQDLEVTNPNLPDALRATQQPTAAETFVATSFRTWWPVGGHDDYPSWAFSTMAGEVTSGFADFGQLETSAQPRTAWNNSPVNARRFVSEDPWYGLYRTISSVNDALAAIARGTVIVDASRTARTKAVGKFIQGIAHGYLGLYFDQAFVVDEKARLDTIVNPQFQTYKELTTAAIAQLDSAIAVAGASSFTLPVDSWLYTALTKDQFIQLCHSFAARLMVYSARSRAERAAVNWTEVIRRIDLGIKTDFAPVAQVDILWDDWKRLVARLRTAGRPSDFGRPAYGLLGPADSANGYLNWLATPLTSRAAFQIRTKDRRIQGAGGPATPGTYVGYNLNNIFDPSRGTWRFSHYYLLRYGTGTTWQTGPQVAMAVSEMDLLKAEALIRLGRAAEAVPLINKTRVANGQLPPVTVDGPPDEAGCVPRKISGQCGSLWDALRYEKGIEGLAVSGVTAFLDARGWQTLPENTLIHLPVPGRELAVLLRPSYTFGGGGEGSAPAPSPETCPVPLSRCP
ncbi:MAG TPA: hypothetical protein VJL28_07135 [Gemmatimonadaceae bacterium]|nr:hypothetical protein [Gemmatimonadaceae bacterium]